MDFSITTAAKATSLKSDYFHLLQMNYSFLLVSSWKKPRLCMTIHLNIKLKVDFLLLSF